MSKINAKPVKVFSRERWRPVPGYEGRYLVSSLGKIRSLGNAKRPAPRTLSAPPNKHGYRVVTLYDGTPGRTSGRKMKVAVLVLLAFRGPAPEGRKDSCHKDGNRRNDCLRNLYWGSRQDNVDDAIKHGRHCRGETNGRAKLSEDDVCRIRQRSVRVSGQQLAQEFGVSPAQISNIVNGKYWSSVCP